ncbi:hypothetical protein TanjilG_20690 [Lupinus angustifolius]|uniref:1-deoxy-D-xylulose-5-phosphate synthase n=1 Tax=Lupinus angustifolius TaxID=3871 RepID=A0A4P1QRR5_LUPAN|nr:hypothetical protein TanjilG_20690 [Lupinus angustifolius]
MAFSNILVNTNHFLLPFHKTQTPNHGCLKKFCVRASTSSNDDGERTIIRKDKDGWNIKFSGKKPTTPLLDTINYPPHMKNLSIQDLEQLAAEIRADIVHTVSDIGGHLSSSLGVVDLSVALHHVFKSPQDKIIWDVGHQAYPHKILTGRRSRMHTIKKSLGLSGFPKRDESVHDAFGTGHSSTSISAGLGMAVARDLLGKNNNVISVIGDGAMTAGQAYEAMNNAGFLDANMIIILNDNKQVSLPTATLDGPATPVGALSRNLSKIQASTKFRKLREVAKTVTKQIGGQTHQVAAKVDEYARGMISGSGSTFFEELGLYYIGPVDGHNIEDLVQIFENVKAMPAPGPILIHVVTEKGKGYPPAEAAADKMHGVVKFDPLSGEQFKQNSSTLTYTQYFVQSLIKEAEIDNKIVAIHAAMGGGTGLNYFQKRFPDRCFDTGIAEQHAVTFAAGLAAEGLKPFCAIYSSFLQRGYDQVVHDVDLQKLPVRFVVDRAGLIGGDGATHHGAFDITYMACLPNMVVMAPSDETELMHMVATATAIDDRPIADARFCKPLDTDLIKLLAKEHEFLITVEEGSIGGFGSHVSHYLSISCILDGPLKWRAMMLPDKYIEHGPPQDQIEEAGLSSYHIAATILSFLQRPKDALLFK